MLNSIVFLIKVSYCLVMKLSSVIFMFNSYLKKIMSKPFLSFFLSSLFLIQSVSVAQTKSQYAKSSKIEKWEKVIIKKDFILSNSLYSHRFCKKVWDYQIPEFKKKNPHIVDVNKFEPGDIVELQLCTDHKYELSADAKSEVDNSFSTLKDGDLTVMNFAPLTPRESKIEVKDSQAKSQEEFVPDFMLLGALGGLAEQDGKVHTSVGFRIFANIKPRIGYRMRIDFTETVLMWHNEILLQTIPSDTNTRYYASFGLGNRMGLKENLVNVNLSNKTTGYTTLAAGTNFKVGAGQVDFQVGSNISNYLSPFASVIASKRLGDSPFTLGGFIDYRSTKGSKEDNNEERHWTGAGLLFSY